MKTIFLALITALVTVAGVSAQDQRFVRIWNDAQKLKPAHITSTERIAPSSEPGTPLVIHGQVVDSAAKPAPGVEIFAYHTDSTGIYAERDAADPWRLKGWAVTDAQGRFELTTIRPAPYPGRDIPAHVHATLTTKSCGKQFTGLMFDGDPLATKGYRDRLAAANEHGLYGKVRVEAGVQHVDYTIRIRAKGDF